MKQIRPLCVLKFCAMLLISFTCSSAFAGLTVERGGEALLLQTAICTTVVRAPIEVGRPVLPNNPLDRLSLVPTICTGGGMKQTEIVGGIFQLLAAGWRIVQFSHQVTTLGETGTSAELLISGVFVLERMPVGAYR